METDEYKI